MKICKQCKKEKEETEFYSESKKRGGLGSYCKECSLFNNKIWRDTHKEQRQADNGSMESDSS